MTLVSMQIAACGITTMDNKTLTINLVGGGSITLNFHDTHSLSSMAETILQAIADTDEDRLAGGNAENNDLSADDTINDESDDGEDDLYTSLDNLKVANDSSFDQEEETQQLFF